jgi:hypothetical protein
VLFLSREREVSLHSITALQLLPPVSNYDQRPRRRPATIAKYLLGVLTILASDLFRQL